jgi:hypothetical protein
VGIRDLLRFGWKGRASKPSSSPAWMTAGFYKEEWFTEADQTITIRVIQVPKKRIKHFCRGGGACHKVVGGMHTIYIPRLMTDNEPIDQQKLGHEVHHALGMKH